MRLGFEVEIEDITKFPPTTPSIEITTDNSLRNGHEFVSKILPDKEYASFLYGYLYKNIQGSYSERCGLHFHMDVTDNTKERNIKFLKRYIKVERTMFRLNSHILRSNNNFCNLLVDSQEELRIIRRYNILDQSPSNYSKYMAINIKPMLSIGTFEFRALKSGVSPQDFESILNIFEQLWDLASPLPYEDEISEEDRQEAESIINLIDTAIVEENIEDEFMNHHFREDGIVTSNNLITEEDILSYLRSS